MMSSASISARAANSFITSRYLGDATPLRSPAVRGCLTVETPRSLAWAQGRPRRHEPPPTGERWRWDRKRRDCGDGQWRRIPAATTHAERGRRRAGPAPWLLRVRDGHGHRLDGRVHAGAWLAVGRAAHRHDRRARGAHSGAG